MARFADQADKLGNLPPPQNGAEFFKNFAEHLSPHQHELLLYYLLSPEQYAQVKANVTGQAPMATDGSAGLASATAPQDPAAMAAPAAPAGPGPSLLPPPPAAGAQPLTP